MFDYTLHSILNLMELINQLDVNYPSEQTEIINKIDECNFVSLQGFSLRILSLKLELQMIIEGKEKTSVSFH